MLQKSYINLIQKNQNKILQNIKYCYNNNINNDTNVD